MFVSVLILVFAVLIIAGGCATGKKIISIDDAMKQFEGVYVNTEYSGQDPHYPQKFVIASDGRIERWASATSEYPSIKGEYTIAKSWTDLKGNMYCTVDVKQYGEARTQDLWKLDKSGKTLEVNYLLGHVGEYPTKIDPNVEPWGPLYYCIFYRQ
jgi:hypothetical protein